MQFMKPASAAAVALAGMLTLAACNAEDNVAVVNGVPISQARMEYVVKTQVQQGQQDNEQLRKQVKDVLITRELLAQEASRKAWTSAGSADRGGDGQAGVPDPRLLRRLHQEQRRHRRGAEGRVRARQGRADREAASARSTRPGTS